MVKTFALLLLSCSLTFAQSPYSINLKSGSFIPEENFEETFQKVVNHENQYFVVQFKSIPSTQERKQMEAMGLIFEDYLPSNAYLVYTPAGVNFSSLNGFDVRAILPYQSSFKISKDFNDEIPAHARKGGSMIRLSILTHNEVSNQEFHQALINLEGQMVQAPKTGNLFFIDIPENHINDVLELKLVKWVEYIEPDPIPDDIRGRSLHRANAIDRPSSNGYHYDGTGVSVALADDGPVGPHIDLEGRLVQVGNMGADGTHGDMTIGILMGAGNLNPNNAGMATGVDMRYYDIFPPGGPAYDHVNSAVSNYDSFGTVITSTSYSEVSGGVYTSTAQFVDQQIHQNPSIIHVFSAGNAGSGYSTITGGRKAAKNTIATANLEYQDIRTNSSSRGPAQDGRVKPDISANGTNQMSLDANNGYSPGGGTSAACPGIAGILAQLYQGYRDLNGGADPTSSLMKGILLNSAEDLGNPGPDYSFGWGRVNALRAFKTMEENRTMEDSLSQGDSMTHTITVPAGVGELKVMVYWLDKEGSPAAGQALVNNLDMTLTDPTNTTWQPWILNPSSPTATATRGVDNLNNMEQVTLSSPAAGTYSLKVKGTNIPFGPQNYHVIYEFRMNGPEITYPIGGEPFVSGETQAIRWDALGNTGSFNLEYSIDSGATWNPIAGSISASQRFFNWNIPSGISTKNGLIRVTRGASFDISDATFNILGIPGNLTVNSSCTDSASLQWSAVNGADGYIVRKLGAQYMDSVEYTTSTSTYIENINFNDPNVWLTVQAVMTNSQGQIIGNGRRAIAIRKATGIFNCPSLAPVASFYADTSGICVNNPVKMNNTSFNSAGNFTWTFTPNTVNFSNNTTANSEEPEVVFLSTNSYNVKLEVSQPGGISTEEKLSYINPIIASSTMNEDFEAGFNLPFNWKIDSGQGPSHWEFQSVLKGANNSPTKSSYFNRFDQQTVNETEGLITKPIDLSGYNNPALIFDVACAYKQNVSNSQAGGLRIDVSDDCGNSFQSSSYYKQGLVLSTTSINPNFWRPLSGSDWRKDTLDLSQYVNSEIKLKFVNVSSRFGNSLYIDNVELIENSPLNLTNNLTESLKIYPNPTNSQFIVEASNVNGERFVISIIDSKGNEVLKKSMNSLNSSLYAKFDLSPLSSGLYTVKVIGENSITVKKVSYIKN